MPKLPKPVVPSVAGKPSSPEDVAVVCGKTEDGKGLHILRRRASGLEAGIVQPLEEGKPIHGELVTLRRRGQSPVCDVEVHYAAPKLEAPADARVELENRGHPAQVASDKYRKNWDTIWSSRPNKKELPN